MKDIHSLIEREKNYCEMMMNFKLNKCEIKENHKKQECMNHHESDKRRSVVDQRNGLSYLPYICYKCQNYQDCRFSHNYEEQMFNPLRYKTESCTEYNRKCSFVDKLYCPYYHDDLNDSRVRLISKYNQVLKQMEEHNNQTQEDQQKDNEMMKWLNGFKTSLCPNINQTNHQFKQCMYYHNEFDIRRTITQDFYYHPTICPNHKNCDQKDKCIYSHNKIEELYHPLRFKRKYCNFQLENNICEYGELCSFAHNESELKLKNKLHFLEQNREFYLMKFKTEQCPFSTNHKRPQCIYTHNLQDLRRSPLVCYYLPIDCQTWVSFDTEKTYDQIKQFCQNQENCNKCHGWKEFDFHPDIYKTRLCRDNNCYRKDKDCSYYHNLKDKRSRPEWVKTKIDYFKNKRKTLSQNQEQQQNNQQISYQQNQNMMNHYIQQQMMIQQNMYQQNMIYNHMDVVPNNYLWNNNINQQMRQLNKPNNKQSIGFNKNQPIRHNNHMTQYYRQQQQDQQTILIQKKQSCMNGSQVSSNGVVLKTDNTKFHSQKGSTPPSEDDHQNHSILVHSQQQVSDSFKYHQVKTQNHLAYTSDDNHYKKKLNTKSNDFYLKEQIQIYSYIDHNSQFIYYLEKTNQTIKQKRDN